MAPIRLFPHGGKTVHMFEQKIMLTNNFRYAKDGA